MTCNSCLLRNRVNINTATRLQLQSLPYIGPVKAEQIISYRNRQGPFLMVKHIMRVWGIKEIIFNYIRKFITVEDELIEKKVRTSEVPIIPAVPVVTQVVIQVPKTPQVVIPVVQVPKTTQVVIPVVQVPKTTQVVIPVVQVLETTQVEQVKQKWSFLETILNIYRKIRNDKLS